MTQLPSAETVLGRFDGRTVALYGSEAVPLEREGRYFIKLPAIRGEPAREAEVALTVGSRRYQQYFERDQGTYRRLPLLWHVGEERWIHMNAVFLEPDDDDWGVHQAVWNQNCIFCHNTAIAPGLHPGPSGEKAFDSHVSDLGIACEACHGPGRTHAEQNASPLTRYRELLGTSEASDIIDPKKLRQKESASLCGQCHSQRLPNPPERIWTYLERGPSFRPGDRLEDHVTPVTRDTPSLDPGQPRLFSDRFWNEGTARLTAYEYLGLTQSPCYAGGELTCLSCHSMHSGQIEGQLTPEMRGDRACTQCHAELEKNIQAHTHHTADSSGSRCLDCHMPRIVYGVLSIHRSHRIESPDVARDVQAGRPNACTLCHADRSAGWAAEAMRRFWGTRYQAPRARPDQAPLDGPEALISLHAGDAVTRAVTVSALGRSNSALPVRERAVLLGNLLVAFGDAYPAVRQLGRASALSLEAELHLGLEKTLVAFDPLGPPEERKRALLSLLDEFSSAARAKLAPPRAGLFLDPSYRLDMASLEKLVRLQAHNPIHIGE